MRWLLTLAFVATVAAAAPRPTAGHEKGSGDGIAGPASFIGYTPCVGGRASGFPCADVDLMAYLPLNLIGGGTANDVWGWTDPLTGKEYVLMGRSTGTSFVDISDPKQPIYLGNLPTRSFQSSWRGIKVYRNHAFIVSEAFGHGVQIFDLTTLRYVDNPPTTFAAAQHYGNFTTHTLAINEDTGYAYAAGTNTCNGGLHMIDINEPLSPRFAGCFAGDGYTHEAQCVLYHGPDGRYGSHEICFNANEDTLTIVDVSSKENPRLISRTTYSGNGYAHQGWLTEDHAYFLVDDELDEINHRHNTRTYVWDVSDLEAPRVAGTYTAATAAIDHNQYVRGPYVFQANYRAGLRILYFDAPPASLREIGFFDIYPADDAPGFNGAWSNYPFFASGVVAISGIEQGLFLVQPSLPQVITPATPTPTPSPGDGHRISGHIRYHGTLAAVPDVMLVLEGSQPDSVLSGADGSFDFPALAPGRWTVTPFKVGDIGSAVTALDAAYVLQSLVGLRVLAPVEELACDVGGKVGLSALDASLILRHQVGLIDRFPVSDLCGTDWLFMAVPVGVPNQHVQQPGLGTAACTAAAVTLDPLVEDADGQDFTAVAFGDCTGNWQGAGTGAAAGTRLAETSAVRLGRLRRDSRGRVMLPLWVDSSLPFHGLQLQLRHDPQLRAQRLLRSQRASAARVAFNASTPGLVRMALASPFPLDPGNDPLLWLQFRSRGGFTPHRVRLSLDRAAD